MASGDKEVMIVVAQSQLGLMNTFKSSEDVSNVDEATTKAQDKQMPSIIDQVCRSVD